MLEQHHVAGQANDPDLTVTLCLNCHQKMSARMPGFGVALEPVAYPTRVERAGNLLRGLAVFFEQLALALMRWAQDLDDTAADLDTRDPEWRAIEGPQP